MALDETAFRVRHPEFKGASSALVTVKLADALKRLSPGLFGTSFDEAHGWLTAHLLATTPWGMAARIDPKLALMTGAKPGSTIYSLELQKLALEAGAGIGVT
jgi:hypothetical protein